MTRNVLLGMVQAYLAVVFLFAGGMKLFLGAEALALPIALPLPMVRALGVAELLGAAGLILPWYLGIRPVFTPLAAAGLLLIVGGATIFTLLGEGLVPALFPLVLTLLCASVIHGRWWRERRVSIGGGA